MIFLTSLPAPRRKQDQPRAEMAEDTTIPHGHPSGARPWPQPLSTGRQGLLQTTGAPRPRVHLTLLQPWNLTKPLPRRAWFSLNRVKESLTASQVKKQSSARRHREGEGDQPVLCPPWLTDGGGRGSQGGWAPKGSSNCSSRSWGWRVGAGLAQIISNC